MAKYDKLVKKAKKSFDEKNYSDAILYFEEAFNEKILYEDLWTLGIAYYFSDRYEAALECFKIFEENQPLDANVFQVIGDIYLDLGKKELGLEYLLKAIENGNEKGNYFRVGLIYNELKDEDKEFEAYKKGVLVEPDHFWMNTNLGSLYDKRGNQEKFLEYSLHAYEIDKTQKVVSYNLGIAYANMGDYEQAIKYYLEEISKEDGVIDAYLNLGLIYHYRDDGGEKAKYYYLKGIEKDKDNSSLWYNLGCLYVLEKDYKNANNCFLYACLKDYKIYDYLLKDTDTEDYIKSVEFKDVKKQLGKD